MPYTPTVWTTAVTALSSAVGNNFESQYLEAINSLGPDWRAFVLTGGVCTIHGGLPKQMDVTDCFYYAQDPSGGTYRRRVINATNFTTVTASTTYFLDYNPDGTSSWATAHSAQPNYVPIASVTTDGSGNISVITDARPIDVNLFLAAVGRLKFGGSFIPEVGTHSTVVYTISAGNGAPGALAANEIYIQLT